MPEKFKHAYEMEVIEGLMLIIEKYISIKKAALGSLYFRLWVGKLLIKFEGLGLIEDPRSVRCGEVIQLLRNEPTFGAKVYAIQQDVSLNHGFH